LAEERKEIEIQPLPTILVQTLKYDGSKHRSWSAELVRQQGALLVLDAIFDRRIEHELLGTIYKGTLSSEYYWLDRWYNVFRFQDSAGNLRNYYCNINQPPSFDGHILSYVDLDIDVLVNPDLSYQVLDLEEFERNALHYGYPRQLQEQARAALNELIGLIKAKAFPFSE